jgi:prepilin-type N-terminal cleavage/methylation domain-containing protein
MKSVFSQDGYGPALSHRRADRRGFTMVEIIAVIAIIALLAAAVTGGVVMAMKRAAIKATQGLFQRLDVAIGMYYEDYGAYPPDGATAWYTNPGPNLNLATETLAYALAGMYEDLSIDSFRENLARKTAYLSFEQRDLKRTGRVFWMNNLQENYDPTTRDDIFPEIVDIWGNPIHYICKDQTNSTDPKGNKDSYDLASRGPDRLTGPPYNERNVKVTIGTKDKYPNRDNITNFEMN